MATIFIRLATTLALALVLLAGTAATPVQVQAPEPGLLPDMTPGPACTWLDAPPGPRTLALPLPPCAWTPEAREALTMMVRIESSSGKDAAAIAWTMARRWLGMARYRGRSFADYVVDTSAPLRAYRAKAPETLTRYQACVIGIESCHAAGASRDDVSRVLDAWARGEVPDPCGGESFQWFAPWYAPARRYRRVECGDTANTFRALPEVSHDAIRAKTFEPVDPGRCR